MIFCTTIALTSLYVLATTAVESSPVSLRARTVPGAAQQLKLVVEVSGELKLNPEGKGLRRVPVTVEAQMEFVERPLPNRDEVTRAAFRQYQECKAKIRVKDSEVNHQLRLDRQLLECHVEKDHVVLWCPEGPLTADELDLVESPFQSVLLPDLLPKKPVRVGESWSIPSGILQAALNLDAINDEQLTATFKEIKDGVAIIDVNGRLSGAADGVSSEVDFKAKLNFDLQRNVVTWLALSLREHRAVGHARPGFETVTKLRLLAEPCDTPPALNDEGLARLPKQGRAASTLIELESGKAGYALLHDRRWRRMTDRHDVAVLRMVDQGDLIAQCNLSTLPPLAKGQQLTLEDFQQDIGRGLGKDFGEFIESTQHLSEDKSLATYRVVASGKVQEIPIQWVYYYLADAEGHRASAVFTMDQKMVERFGVADRELMPTFRFVEEPAKAPVQASEKAKGMKR